MIPRRTYVIVVSGPPGVGKTALAVPLAAALGLPLINKDGLKEVLFDRLGTGDRAWSRLLGQASIELMEHVLERLVRAKCSVILESNFRPEHDQGRMRRLQGRHGFRALQLQLTADPDVLERRFLARAESGERHPGHGDRDLLEEVAPFLRAGRLEPLDLDGEVWWIDVTEPWSVNVEALADRVRRWEIGQ